MLRRAVYRLVVVVAAALIGFGAWGGLIALRAQQEGDRFDFVRWEAQALPDRPLFLVGRPFRHDLPADQALRQYFALADREAPSAARLQNEAEAAIEQRVSTVLRGQGIGWPLPGFFPPVDIKLAPTPRILVVSPRARIERLRADPLRPDFTGAQARSLEAKIERDPKLSALVVPSGGIATYPAIVAADDNYADTIQAAAHEWTHHYLALYPLGQAYFSSNDAQTINETVADTVGDTVAQLALRRWGNPEPPASGAPSSPPPAGTPAPTVDVTKVLYELRIEVDGLLARGDIAGAERRMNEVRDQLAASGINIRRINQAYFAWYGTYAARPESTDPLGGQVRSILQRAGSLQRFLEEIRTVHSRAEIAQLAAGG